MNRRVELDYSALWRHRWLLLSAWLIAAFAAVSWYHTLPDRWAAVSLIRVGGLGETDPAQATANAQSELLSPASLARAAKLANYPTDVPGLLAGAYGGRGEAQAMPLAGTRLIALRVVTDEALKSERIAQAMVSQFVQERNLQMKPLLDARLAQVSAIQEALTKFSNSRDAAQDGLVQCIPRGLIVARLNTILLRARESVIYPAFIDTRVMESVSVLPQPVGPGLLFAIGLGVTLGILLSLGIVILDAFWQPTRR